MTSAVNAVDRKLVVSACSKSSMHADGWPLLKTDNTETGFVGISESTSDMLEWFDIETFLRRDLDLR